MCLYLSPTLLFHRSTTELDGELLETLPRMMFHQESVTFSNTDSTKAEEWKHFKCECETFEQEPEFETFLMETFVLPQVAMKRK